MKYLLMLLSFTIYSQKDTNLYEGRVINSIATFQFKKASFYDYQLNCQNTDSIYRNVKNGSSPEAILSNLNENFFVKVDESDVREMILLYRITINYNLTEYYFIKYSLNEKIKKTTKTIVFIKEKNNWTVFDGNNEVVENVNIIMDLNNIGYSQFEIEDKDLNHPVINNLKKLIRDEDGIINLYKFSRIVKQNKSLLSKYIE